MSACSADDAKGLARPNSRAMQALAYGFLNISTTVGIVFVNKLIMGHYDFKYPVALTWIHTVRPFCSCLAVATSHLQSIESALPFAAACLPVQCVRHSAMHVLADVFWRYLCMQLAHTRS